jgi:outer membrane protein assembly factor BamA
MTRGLDSNNDWIFGIGANAYLTANAEVAINIQTRVLSFLNDCFFDTGAGLNWWALLGSKNQAALQLSIGTVILNTNNVTGNLQLSVIYNSQTRGLSIVYKVQTTYSQLSNQFQYNFGATSAPAA